MTVSQHLNYLVQELDKLGDSPDEIAFSLKQEGIKGVVCYGRECPLANFAKKRGFTNPEFSSFYARSVETDYTYIPLKKSLRDFMSLFDQRLYPDLIGE